MLSGFARTGELTYYIKLLLQYNGHTAGDDANLYFVCLDQQHVHLHAASYMALPVLHTIILYSSSSVLSDRITELLLILSCQTHMC